jgi:hypothetical protein
MTLLYRLGLALGLSVLFLCGLARCAGIDLGLDDVARLAREKERGAALERRCRNMAARTTGKQQVTDQVIARRLTLLEAADAFRRIDEAADADAPADASPVPEDRSDEGLCENVLVWVAAALNNDRRDAAVLRDLEAQFVARFHHPPAHRAWPLAG